MIDDELSRAGVDVEALRADAQAAVEAETPDGWVALMVRSPWRESACPSCGAVVTVENMGVAALTRRLERPRTLLFALVVVCDRCVADSRWLDVLAERVFE